WRPAAPPALQGGDPTPVLADPAARLRTHVTSELNGRVMVRDERYKYVQYRGGAAELFDLERDPREVENLAGDPAAAETASRLRALLVEHFLEGAAARGAASRAPDDSHRIHQRRVPGRL